MRIRSLLLATLLIAGLAACGQKTDKAAESASKAKEAMSQAADATKEAADKAAAATKEAADKAKDAVKN